MANNIPASINYTNRDFYSLRDDLIARVQYRLNPPGTVRWSGTDPSDFGVALVEAFAYIGDISNYYIDRAANENTLATAVQRQSVLDIASLFNYVPAGYQQASVPVTITNQDAVNGINLLAGTVFITYITVNEVTSSLHFTLDSDTSVSAASSVSAELSHGASYTEVLGSSNGFANQSFTLKKSPVVDGTVTLTIDDGNSAVFWTQVPQLLDYGPNSSVYTQSVDAADLVTLSLGDGISGAIPTFGSVISATYTVGGGLVGNIPANSSFTVSFFPNGAVDPTATVTATATSAGTGGENAESTDSIRVNVPKALRTLSRAVSLADYKDLALSISGVGKALAKANQQNSVVLYVGPSVSDTSLDFYPGLDSANVATTSSWKNLQSNITTYFEDKTQIGVNVSVVPPTYVPVKTEVQYNSNNLYTHDQVINGIKYQIVGGYGYNYLDFNTTIYPEQIESSLMNIAGITSVKVTKLYRTGGSVARTTLVPTNGEYFVFMDENTVAYPVASLKTMVLSSGSLSPTFQSHIFTYNSTNVSTSTIALTPTVWDTSCVITVNGNVVTSGSASSTISTPASATTTISVKVTSADGTSSNGYVITVVR